MQTFIAPGQTITLIAPYNVLSGDGLLVGSIFGIAAYDAGTDSEVETTLEGIFAIKKVSQTWKQGALIYWDDKAKNCTSIATDNKLIGVAVMAAANSDKTANVRLNSAFIG